MSECHWAYMYMFEIFYCFILFVHCTVFGVSIGFCILRLKNELLIIDYCLFIKWTINGLHCLYSFYLPFTLIYFLQLCIMYYVFSNTEYNETVYSVAPLHGIWNHSPVLLMCQIQSADTIHRVSAFGSQAFLVAAANIWNALPDNVASASYVNLSTENFAVSAIFLC